MKKHLIIILAILLLSSFLASPAAIKAQPSSIPHEDPQTAQSTIDAFSFLSQYVEIFGFMANGQYTNASLLGEELSQIDVPEEYRYIIAQYNELTQQLISTINNLDSTLVEASSLLDQYRLDEARQKIDEAGVLVAKAQILLNDLQESTQTLSQRLGILSSPVEDKARQAYIELENLLDRIYELIGRYHQLLQSANQRIEGSQQIILTNLSISSDVSECFVGSTLQVSGTLTTSSGQKLGNRAIQILLDGEVIATINTATNGAYHTQIHAPYKYVDHFSINALYTPQGNDKGTYLASVSPTIKVKLLYYQTNLNINAPSIAYPGLAMVIQANVTSQDGTPLNARQIRVLLNGTQIGQTQTDEMGVCTIKPIISDQAKLGNYTLTVKVDPSGVYSDVSKSKTISIQKRATNLQVSSPSLLILPTQLKISGFVQSTSGPLKNANIIVEFANITSTTKTSNNGSFSITLDVPFSTVFAGNQELKVIAQPAEPWQATAQKTSNLLVLNAIGIAVALASGVTILLLTYGKYAKSSNKKEKGKTIKTLPSTTLQEMGGSALSSATILQTKFEGVKGRVLRAYINGADAIQSTTGESLTANMTLREYLKKTTPKIVKTSQSFANLTSLAEKSLYSPHPTKPQDAEEAEKLAIAIKEETN